MHTADTGGAGGPVSSAGQMSFVSTLMWTRNSVHFERVMTGGGSLRVDQSFSSRAFFFFFFLKNPNCFFTSLDWEMPSFSECVQNCKDAFHFLKALKYKSKQLEIEGKVSECIHIIIIFTPLTKSNCLKIFFTKLRKQNSKRFSGLKRKVHIFLADQQLWEL